MIYYFNIIFCKLAFCKIVISRKQIYFFVNIFIVFVISAVSELPAVSDCCTVTLFSGFAYAALIVVGYLLLGSKIGLTACLAAFAALTLLLAALLLRWLHKTGCRIFASL